MGDANTPLTAADARHLLRRTGFGARALDLERLLRKASTRGEAADYVLNFQPSHFKPHGKDIGTTRNRWIQYMARTPRALQEKLVLFWHDHFATSNAKVQNQDLMARQNQLLRQNCKGNFKAFVKAINKDGAMMDFLDTVRSRKQQPNENYPRELMELFTLGVYDFAGNPNYMQEDIVQIARAFSGWQYDRKKHVAYLNPSRHDFMADYSERGDKVIFQSTGGFGSSGRAFALDPGPPDEGPDEIDTVIDIIFDHTDTDGKKTVARYIAHKLLTYFAYADVETAVVDDVVGASGFDASWNLEDLLRAIFVHDAFYATAAPAPWDSATKKSVKWPVDYMISTLRLLNMKLKGRYQYVNGGSYQAAQDQLENMGQILLEPPSVFGWDWETAWISSSTLLARYQFARDLTSARDKGRTGFHPERHALVDIGLTAPGAIVDAVTDLLGVTDQLTASERQILVDYVGENGSVTSLDLTDYDVRNIKLHGLVALLLQSPAYQLH